MGFLDSIAVASRGFAETLEKGKRPDASFAVQQTYEPSTQGPTAMFEDPYAVLNNLGYKASAKPITFTTMDIMMRRCPLIAGIIQTRLANMHSFSRLPRDRFDTGFRIVTEDGAEKMSPADRKKAKQIEQWVLSCGVGPRSRDRYPAFMKKVMRDSLRYDQATWQIVHNKKGIPAELWAVDAKTIRLADTKGAFYEDISEKLPHTVQIKDSMVIREWLREDLVFAIRNPHTDIELQGYGVSETEWLIEAITGFLFGFQHNSLRYSQGTTAKGLLQVKGFANETQLNAFRRFWVQMVSGVSNAWRIPVINVDEVKWVPMDTSNVDMEFSEWMNFLTQIICAVFLLDPSELSTKYGTAAAGKCYAPETAILMFDGSIRTADSINVGDQLMGPDSTPRNVLSTTHGHAEMFEIVPKRGDPWRCNGAHELTLWSPYKHAAVDIPVAEFLQLPVGSQGDYQLFQPPGVTFPVRSDPILDPYFYGVWVGDGSKSFSQGVVVTKPDPEVVAALARTAKHWGLSLNPCGKYGHRLAGVPGARAENKLRTAIDTLWSDGSIDDSIKLGSWETRRQFLAGFLDTDGSLDRHSFEFSQKNKRTADDVAFIARSLGFRVSLSVKIVGGTEYMRGYISGPCALIPTQIKRKQAPMALGRTEPLRTGFTIRPVGTGAYNGWLTDGDHRHLLADFTVSHNSMFEASGKEKIEASKDKGLQPLADFWADTMNAHVISKLEPGFLLEHVGLDAQSKQEDASLTESLAKTTHTTNELRARDGLGRAPPVDGVDYGDVIMSPTVVQYINAVSAQQAQAEALKASQQQGGDGMGGPDDGAGGPPGDQEDSPPDEPTNDEPANDAPPADEPSPELSLFEKAFPNTQTAEVLRKARTKPSTKERVLLDVVIA